MGKEGTTKWQKRALFCITGVALCIASYIKNEDIANKEYFSSGSMKFLSGFFIFVLLLLSVICWDISMLDPADSHTTMSVLPQYLHTRFEPLSGQWFIRKYKKNAKHLVAQQEQLLMQIITMNKNTTYGKENGINDIKSIEDFRKNHPIVSYEHYKRYIDMICDGKKRILTETDTVFVVKTSGTTGKSKLFPYSIQWLKIFKSFLSFQKYLYKEKGIKINLHKEFLMFTPSPMNETKYGLKIGYIFTFMYKYSSLFSYPKEVIEITNEKTSMYLHALFVIKEREVGSFSFIFASQAYSLFRYIESEWEKFYSDIEMGTISVNPDKTDEDVILRLKALIKPDKDRALQFLDAKKKGMTGIAKRLWPGLACCKCITTGSMAVYAKHLRNGVLKGVPVITLSYLGSEGAYGLHFSPIVEDPCYTLSYMFGFFEFIPVKYADKAEPDLRNVILLPHQLKIDEEYELVLTNANGLFRYRIGDVIKVKSFLHQCPVFELMYRTGEIFNLNGEKTTDRMLYNALVKASAALNVNLIDYTTCEDVSMYAIKGFMETSEYKGRYVLFIEVDRILHSTETQKYDDCLCAESDTYNWFRKTKEYIGPMKVIQVQPQTFQLLRESMAHEKRNYLQFKLPRKLKTENHLQFLFDRRMITD